MWLIDLFFSSFWEHWSSVAQVNNSNGAFAGFRLLAFSCDFLTVRKNRITPFTWTLWRTGLECEMIHSWLTYLAFKWSRHHGDCTEILKEQFCALPVFSPHQNIYILFCIDHHPLGGGGWIGPMRVGEARIRKPHGDWKSCSLTTVFLIFQLMI